VRLCLDQGETVGAPFPYAALTREVLSTAAGLGHGEDDFAALIEALERAAGARL
jgi:3-hydroxyisobutyrate dehydrogenase-like beta-hydroxyacid dehydrogenase